MLASSSRAGMIMVMNGACSADGHDAEAKAGQKPALFDGPHDQPGHDREPYGGYQKLHSLNDK